MTTSSTKQQLCIYLQQYVANKKDELIKAIDSAKESRDNDSKSSVGDKHETSRALAQIEIDKLEVQLDKTLHSEQEVSLLHPEKVHSKVEFGSLVYTNHETYLISMGLGKVELNNETYYCISLGSPIGKVLHGKIAGDRITFNGKEIEVVKVF